jgi:hypothetical protein
LCQTETFSDTGARSLHFLPSDRADDQAKDLIVG